MIVNITDQISTAAYADVSHESSGCLIDVRPLLDGDGNSVKQIRESIDLAESILKTKGRVVIACDMGISRSRVVAIGLLVKLGWNYISALKHVLQVTNHPEINASLFQSLKLALGVEGSGEKAIPEKFGVLLLGDDGFVGSNLQQSLSKWLEVKSLGRKDFDFSSDLLEMNESLGNYEFETLVLAAHPRSHHSVGSFSKYLAIVKNALDLAVIRQTRFVLISSPAVFSGTARREEAYIYRPAPREVPSPCGTYAESKYISEELVRLYRRNYGLRAMIVRAPTLYGEGMAEALFIPKTIKSILENRDVVTHMYSNGMPLFELLHVHDFCEAINSALRLDVFPEELSIGKGQVISTHEFAKMVVSLTGREIVCSLMSVEKNIYNVQIGHLEADCLIGWEPKISLENGVKRLIESCR
jgi:UDP-glucuronate decarboxylase